MILFVFKVDMFYECDCWMSLVFKVYLCVYNVYVNMKN